MVLKNKAPIGEQGEHGYFVLFKDPNENELCLCSEK
jgi:predicted enzyme related to lactoylglutathione lyase